MGKKKKNTLLIRIWDALFQIAFVWSSDFTHNLECFSGVVSVAMACPYRLKHHMN